MSAMASQITSHTFVYSTVYTGADQRKHQSSALLAICADNSPVTEELPAQKFSNAENVSIWWRHHVKLVPGDVLHHGIPPSKYVLVIEKRTYLPQLRLQ